MCPVAVFAVCDQGRRTVPVYCRGILKGGHVDSSLLPALRSAGDIIEIAFRLSERQPINQYESFFRVTAATALEWANFCSISNPFISSPEMDRMLIVSKASVIRS